MTGHRPAAVLVAIPAHDEQDLLPGCLASVRAARRPLRRDRPRHRDQHRAGAAGDRARRHLDRQHRRGQHGAARLVAAPAGAGGGRRRAGAGNRATRPRAHRPGTAGRLFAEHQLDERHPHVFGATLGLRADVWAAVDGFGPRSLHEDVALVQRVRSRFRVGTSDVHRVRTSSRLTNRVAGGLGGYLATLTPAAALP